MWHLKETEGSVFAQRRLAARKGIYFLSNHHPQQVTEKVEQNGKS